MIDSHFAYQQILDAVKNGILATNSTGIIVFCNDRAKNFLSSHRSNILGVPIIEVLPLSGDHVMKCLQTGKSKLNRQIYGQQIDLMVDVIPIKENGEIQGAVCSFQKMKQVESTSKKMKFFKNINKQLEVIFESSSDGLWVCDGQGKVIRINKASAKLNGVKREDVIGKSSQHMINESVIDRSAVLEVLALKRKVSLMQYLPRTKKYVLVTGTPSFDEKGNISLVVLNERDITQLSRISKELEHACMVSEGYKDELLQLQMLEIKKRDFIAKDNKMKQVLGTVLKLARMEASNILILGESGTGKGVLAKLIHENSKLKKKTFVQINCAALPDSLLEAELFGYEKGAFTGASEQGKVGLFELANEGTLFLDEIGDLPLSVQAKLLKYLDDHEIMRLGSIKQKKINCRVIAATNRDLNSLVKKRRFRGDLLYRLNTFTIQIPPLRERPDDILELVNHFLSEFNESNNSRKRITNKGFEVFRTHPFPGNVRELKSLINQAVVFSEQDLLDDFLVEKFKRTSSKPKVYFDKKKEGRDFHDNILTLERELIKNAILKCKSTREIATYLGISQSTAVRKLKKHSLLIK